MVGQIHRKDYCCPIYLTIVLSTQIVGCSKMILVVGEFSRAITESSGFVITMIGQKDGVALIIWLFAEAESGMISFVTESNSF